MHKKTGLAIQGDHAQSLVRLYAKHKEYGSLNESVPVHMQSAFLSVT